MKNNNEYMYVDDDMRSRLESKLIYSIIKSLKSCLKIMRVL